MRSSACPCNTASFPRRQTQFRLPRSRAKASSNTNGLRSGTLVLMRDACRQKKSSESVRLETVPEKPFDDRQRDDAGQNNQKSRKKTGAPAGKKDFSHLPKFRTAPDFCEREIFGRVCATGDFPRASFSGARASARKSSWPSKCKMP